MMRLRAFLMSLFHPPSVFSFRYGIFDLDGTLIDSVGLCTDTFAELMALYGIPRHFSSMFYRETTGTPMAIVFERYLREHGIAASDHDIASLCSRFDTIYAASTTRSLSGAATFLRALRRTDVTLFISSASSDANVEKRLRYHGFLKYFQTYYGSSTVPKGTRHIDTFAKHVGVPTSIFAANAFFVGDGTTDMRIARAANIHAVGLIGTTSRWQLIRAGANRTVTGLEDLLYDDFIPHRK